MRIKVFVILLLFAVGARAQSPVASGVSGSGLNKALANALYCQLTGCTMTGALVVNTNAAALPTALTGTLIQTGAADGTSTRTLIDAFASNGQLAFRRANTTALNPSALANGDFIGGFAAFGFGATAYASGARARVDAVAAETWTDAAQGAYLALATSAQGAASAVERLRVTPQGITLPIGSIFTVASDFTTASSTALQTITGLSFILQANSAGVYPFHCEILYNQTVAAVSDSFGIQAASLAPTNIMAKGDVSTSASVTAFGNLPTLATTTATSFVTFTPSAITTVWNARLAGIIENPSGVANTINIMVSQSTAADLIVIKRGSYCVVGF